MDSLFPPLHCRILDVLDRHRPQGARRVYQQVKALYPLCSDTRRQVELELRMMSLGKGARVKHNDLGYWRA